MSGRPSWKSAEIGLFRPFSPIQRVQRAPGKSRKRRKKAVFLRYPQICLNTHLLNPHLRHPKKNPCVFRGFPCFFPKKQGLEDQARSGPTSGKVRLANARLAGLQHPRCLLCSSRRRPATRGLLQPRFLWLYHGSRLDGQNRQSPIERGEETPTPKISALLRKRPVLLRPNFVLTKDRKRLTTDIFVVKYTGRDLVVKRPGVLSKVQMLNLVLGVGGLFPSSKPKGVFAEKKARLRGKWGSTCLAKNKHW